MAYSYVQYVGNGSTVSFAVPFSYLSQTHVEVRVNNVLKTAGVDYTWSMPTSITFSTAPATGLTVDIRRKSSPSVRLVDFQDGSTLTQDVLDTDSNQNFFLAQESFDAVDQRLPLDTDGQWNANSRRIKNLTDPVNAQDAATKNWAENSATSFIVAAQAQANAASGSATAAANSATSAASSATSATSSANSASTSATNAASSASTATTKASEASTSATNAATSATNAANSATTASGYLTSVQTNATNAANSATAASSSATNAASSASSATSSATNAATSAANAASSESNANSSKLAAAGSATSAANSAASASTSATTATTAKNDALAIYGSISAVNTAVTSAQTSATNAGTSATNAASSATNAANSATAASDSATSAASSSVSAATSATNAAAIYGSAAALNTAVNSAANSATNAGTSAAQASSSQSAAATSATNAANSATQAAASASTAAAITLGVASNRASVRPSLLLDFANTRQLDPRVTFSRASTGRYYDGTSVVKAEENLLTYSEQFDNATWTLSNTTVTANATTAPDGTSTADQLTGSAGTALKYVTHATLTALNNATATYSIYAKQGTHQFIQIDISGDATKYVNFDLSGSGAYIANGAGVTASVTAVANGFIRCSVTLTGAASTSRFYLSLQDSLAATREATTASTGYVYIWGAQLEIRPTVTAYTPTTTSAITNYIPAMQTALVDKPRFDVDPVTGESKGLLIEEQRSNYCVYSANFGTVWYTSQASVSAAVGISLDGTQSVSALTDTTAAADHYVRQDTTGTSTNQAYTYSVYAKAGSNTVIGLVLADGISGQPTCNYDLANGVCQVRSYGGVGSWTNISCAMYAVGNGWYRCTMTATKGAGTYVSTRVYLLNNYAASGALSYTGTGSGTVYLWGAQLEAGSFATSYIPTVSSQVTRSADSAMMTGTNFSSWYRADEGTLYGEATSPSTGYVASLNDGSTTTYITLVNGSGAGAFQDVISSTVYATIGTRALSGKIAGAYKTDDFAVSVNGAAVATDTSGVVAQVNRLLIGTPINTSFNLNGTIKRIAYYPKRLSNTELQGITNNS